MTTQQRLPTSRRGTPIWVALGLSLGVAACSAPDRPDVVLVTVDTLRADRLGAYGHDGGLTPTLDRLAREGVTFEDATAPTPITLPSHSSLLTGRYPPATGVRNNGTFVLPETEQTLAEVLSEAGWATGAVIGAFPLKRRFGVAQGFDRYDDAIPEPAATADGSMPVHFPERRAAEVTDRALAAWSALGDGDRFLWVHYFDPHAPYTPPSTIDPSGEASDSADPAVRQRARYDGEVAYTDRELGRLLDRILSERPDTIVVVAADHGEALGDHGEKTHGIFLYQSTLAVPLIVRAPGRLPAGRRVSAPVSLVDVLPTLLGLLGIDPPDDLQGADLAPLIAGGPPPERPVYAESLMASLDFRFAELYALRSGRLKYIDAPGPELYDLGADPGESENLAEGDPRLPVLAEELAAHLASYAPRTGLASATVDPQDLARLRSLGYVAGGAPAPGDGEPRGRDPKEMREYFRRHDHALGVISEGRITEGVRELRALLELAPENYLISYQIAAALLAAGEASAAVEAAAAITRADPGFAGGHLLLGEALFRVGRIDEAIESHRIAADLLPSSGDPDATLGDLLREFGRFEPAAQAYLRAIAREPGRLDFVRRLLHLRISRGAVDRAVVELAALAERHPDSAAARLGLAEALLAQDRDDASRTEVEGLLQTRPDYAPAHALRGLQLEKAGDRLAAVAAFTEALRLDPTDGTARAGLARLSPP